MKVIYNANHGEILWKMTLRLWFKTAVQDGGVIGSAKWRWYWRWKITVILWQSRQSTMVCIKMTVILAVQYKVNIFGSKRQRYWQCGMTEKLATQFFANHSCVNTLCSAKTTGHMGDLANKLPVLLIPVDLDLSRLSLVTDTPRQPSVGQGQVTGWPFRLVAFWLPRPCLALLQASVNVSLSWLLCCRRL